MALLDKSKASYAFKALLGRAHTSNDRELYNEAIPSGIIVSGTRVFADKISPNPNDSSNSGIVSAQIPLLLEAVLGSDTVTSGTYLAYRCKLGASVPQSLVGKINPLTGVAYQANDYVGNIIPQSFGTDFRPILYSDTALTNEIPPSDSSDWFIDCFSGVIVQEAGGDGTSFNLGGNGRLKAYIYTGRFVTDALASVGSGGSSLTEWKDSVKGFSGTLDSGTTYTLAGTVSYSGSTAVDNTAKTVTFPGNLTANPYLIVGNYLQTNTNGYAQITSVTLSGGNTLVATSSPTSGVIVQNTTTTGVWSATTPTTISLYELPDLSGSVLSSASLTNGLRWIHKGNPVIVNVYDPTANTFAAGVVGDNYIVEYYTGAQNGYKVTAPTTGSFTSVDTINSYVWRYTGSAWTKQEFEKTVPVRANLSMLTALGGVNDWQALSNDHLSPAASVTEFEVHINGVKLADAVTYRTYTATPDNTFSPNNDTQFTSNLTYNIGEAIRIEIAGQMFIVNVSETNGNVITVADSIGGTIDSVAKISTTLSDPTNSDARLFVNTDVLGYGIDNLDEGTLIYYKLA